MSKVPAGLKYTKEHEWVKSEGNTAVIGITDHAQTQLGDIVFVELPKVGAAVQQMKTRSTGRDNRRPRRSGPRVRERCR